MINYKDINKFKVGHLELIGAIKNEYVKSELKSILEYLNINNINIVLFELINYKYTIVSNDCFNDIKDLDIIDLLINNIRYLKYKVVK